MPLFVWHTIKRTHTVCTIITFKHTSHVWHKIINMHSNSFHTRLLWIFHIWSACEKLSGFRSMITMLVCWPILISKHQWNIILIKIQRFKKPEFWLLLSRMCSIPYPINAVIEMLCLDMVHFFSFFLVIWPEWLTLLYIPLCRWILIVCSPPWIHSWVCLV